MSTPAKLIFFCAKMAAGKSTLAKALAEREHAVVLSQDELVERLFPGEIVESPGASDTAAPIKGEEGPAARRVRPRKAAA